MLSFDLPGYDGLRFAEHGSATTRSSKHQIVFLGNIPMSKTATITLGGQQLVIHAFSIGELERVTALFEGGSPNTMRTAFGILRIALERAEPKIDHPEQIEIESMDEVIEASNAILTLAGLNKKPNGSAGDPQTGPAAGS